MKVALIAIVSLFSIMALAQVETKEFDAQGLESLRVRNTSGNVNIEVSTDQKAYVTSNKVTFGKKCELVVLGSTKELVVENRRNGVGWVSSPQCEVHLTIKVPKDINIDLATGSGNAEVKGIAGKVILKTGSGNLYVDGKVLELSARAGSGTINAKGLLGSAEVKTGSGNIDLYYNEVPTPGELSIKAGSGNVSIYMPESTELLTHFMAGSGRLSNEIGDTSGAKFRVSMAAGSGNLNVKKLTQ